MSKPEDSTTATLDTDVAAAPPADLMPETRNEDAPAAAEENQLKISAKRPAAGWLPQIRELLRLHPEVELSALGRAISTLTDAAQQLVNAHVAKKKSITMGTVAVQRRGEQSSEPRAKLTVVLERGEKYYYLDGYRMRKTMSLFDRLWAHENNHKAPTVDEVDKVDTVQVKSVKDLGLNFGSEEFRDQANGVLQTSKSEKLVAEEFAQYVSYLVGPKCSKDAFDAQMREQLDKLRDPAKATE